MGAPSVVLWNVIPFNDQIYFSSGSAYGLNRGGLTSVIETKDKIDKSWERWTLRR